MIFNKTVFKRFFLRKNQDSSTDWTLPLMFISIVAFSTGLIFFSSIQLNTYQQEKDQYLSDEWNHVYNFYIGDTIK